jgi:hypothetical protein
MAEICRAAAARVSEASVEKFLRDPEWLADPCGKARREAEESIDELRTRRHGRSSFGRQKCADAEDLAAGRSSLCNRPPRPSHRPRRCYGSTACRSPVSCGEHSFSAGFAAVRVRGTGALHSTNARVTSGRFSGSGMRTGHVA